MRLWQQELGALPVLGHPRGLSGSHKAQGPKGSVCPIYHTFSIQYYLCLLQFPLSPCTNSTAHAAVSVRCWGA